MRFETFDVDPQILECSGCCTLASIDDGHYELSVVILMDEDDKNISYEYELYEYQRQLYHWRAPNVSRLDADQLYALLSKMLQGERLERMEERYGA